MNVAVRPEHLNIISLCTGGGGLDLGIELAMPGARSVVLVEREAFACGHLVAAMQQGLLGQAPIWSDVTTFNGRPWRGIVDGVIGGIPCQPHSLAGKRAGCDDERDLWSDARRIIVQSGAWFVLIENVSGMLSAKPGLDPGALRVRRDLQRLGFDVEGGLFTAAEVGASHERERVFILAVADADRRQFAGRPAVGREAAGGRPYAEFAGSGSGLPGSDVGHTHHARLERHGQHGERPGEWPSGQDGPELVNAAGDGRREGRPEPELRSGRDSARRSDGPMGHADDQRQPQPSGIVADIGRRSGDHGRPMADSDILELRRQPSTRQQLQLQRDNALGLFPPGPSDLSSWRHTLERAPELEPAFRRVADGLASRMDIARVDRLRMLGNGVVQLEAAYAVRTLATRLAASGSPGAARLVRMMDISPTQKLEAAE